MLGFLLARADFASVTCFAPLPMKAAIISRFSVGMFEAGGLSDSEADAIEGVYSARHILPTFAEVANRNPSDR